MSEETERSEDVEGHAKRFHRSDDAEAPEDPATLDEAPEAAEAEDDVEGHAKRFH